MMTMKKGRHQAATDQKTKAKRKLLGIPIVWWLLAGTTGVALAAWAIINSFAGTITTGQINVDYDTTQTPVIEAGTCTAVYTGADELTLTWDETLGGDICEVRAHFTTGGNNTQAVQLQEFVAPAGVNASLGAWCGPGSEIGIGVGTTIDAKVVLEIDPVNSSPGDTFVFQPTDGFSWVASSQYNPGACS